MGKRFQRLEKISWKNICLELTPAEAKELLELIGNNCECELKSKVIRRLKIYDKLDVGIKYTKHLNE